MLALALSLWFSSSTVFADNNTVCANTGKDPITNDGVNNYLIAKLEGAGQAIPFAYAMNKCSPHNLEGGPYYRHWCQSTTVAMVQAFHDANCTHNISGPITVVKGNPGDIGDFECGGQDTYAKLLIGRDRSNSNVCPELKTIYAGVGVCITASPSLKSTYSVYCDSTGAKFEWFIDFPNIGRSSRHGNEQEFETTKEESESESEPEASWSPSTTQGKHDHHGGDSGESGSASGESEEGHTSESPVTTEPGKFNATCSSRFYCFDWIIASGDCQPIDTGSLHGSSGLWGKLDECTATAAETATSAAAVHFQFTALWIAVAAMLFGAFLQ